jgi:integrase
VSKRALARPQPATPLVPFGATRDEKSRLSLYEGWLRSTDQRWYTPDLRAYADYLTAQRGLQAATVQAHLSSIRTRYADLTRDRDLFYRLAPEGDSIADQKAMVDEIIARIEHAIHPRAVRLKAHKSQDKPDLLHVRLTAAQVNTLLHLPNVSTVRGLRDVALIALMLCTGAREAEAAAATVADLRQSLNGEPSFHIREGKGAKERLVPYGELEWVLPLVDKWLHRAGIVAGSVFRRVYKNDRAGTDALTTRAIQKILEGYPIVVSGRLIAIRPHDLRRTYARRLYDNGVDPIRIQQNLGHADLKTTLHYIGSIDARQRRPPAIYEIPHDLLI